MANPQIGYLSRLDYDTITSDPTANPEYSLENLRDDRVYTLCKPSAATTSWKITTFTGGTNVTVNYLGIIGHNLSTIGAKVRFMGSFDASVWLIVLNFSPITDRVIYRTFTERSFSYWMLEILTGSPTTPEIGEVKWGYALSFPYGIEYPYDHRSRDVEMQANYSQTGNITSVLRTRVMRRAEVRLRLFPWSWVSDETPEGFSDFLYNHAYLGRPFFWAWNPGNPGDWEDDTMFAVLEGLQITESIATPLDAGVRNVEMTFISTGER